VHFSLGDTQVGSNWQGAKQLPDGQWSHCQAVAAPAIDKIGPRPYHFRLGPTSGPTTRPQEEAKKVKLEYSLKFSINYA